MPVELECKVRLDSHDPLRERLRAAGAIRVGRVLETNTIYDRDDGSLRRAGCGLRVRFVIALDGEAKRPTLTFKGPRQPGPFKRREEIEVAIADADAMAVILHALGFHERIIFEKRRESWRLGACHIELDELPRLGLFVEIEADDEATIRASLNDLGLDQAESIVTSYASMVAALGDGISPAPIEVRFD
jgi:adenylate cyclase class 2